MSEKGTMDHHRVRPGTEVDLAASDPDDSSGFDGGKKEGRAHLEVLRERLDAAQELFWADGSKRLLVVLQAMDSGGKDGAIEKVFSGINPQGVKVHAFGVPTAQELAHDYLWRVHARMPGDGEIAVFNRSHYEDVLVVRVMELAAEEVWSRRYEHIVAFEQMLVEEGTTTVKFMINISQEEQAARLQVRIDDPDKRWKFNSGDLEHRARWDDYMAAFAEAIGRTSTETAPWYIVPGNRKWYRDLVIATTIVETLEGLDLRFPEPEEGIADIVVT
ncbi:polyphosphate kinase 2 family protein [soil metagenome]